MIHSNLRKAHICKRFKSEIHYSTNFVDVYIFFQDLDLRELVGSASSPPLGETVGWRPPLQGDRLSSNNHKNHNNH